MPATASLTTHSMQQIDLHLRPPKLHDTFRVRQISAMFDLDPMVHTRHAMTATVPDLSDPWQIGVITGPSGSGKTVLAKAAYGRAIRTPRRWPTDKAVVDCMGLHPIRSIVTALTAVGFSSPPAWLKPHAVLSTGQQFRGELAAVMLDAKPLVVIDEFTGALDRTVARTVSLGLSRAIRAGKFTSRLVAVTGHLDILPWLRPDWVLDVSTQQLTWSLWPEPKLNIRISRGSTSAWKHFAPHHYLSGKLHPAAQCFIASVDDRLAAFTAVLPFPHPRRPGYREHRTVCLPDYQGIGVGSHLSESVAAMYVATGKPYFSRTSHPAWIRHRLKSPNWRLLGRIGMVARSGLTSRDNTEMANTNSRGRLTAGFEYVGSPNAREGKGLGILA